jgi:hypothetical protein
MNIEPVWLLTSMELFFLGGLLQLSGFLGVADPFVECPQDDIQEYLQLARHSLIQRGYLVQTADGEQVDPALSALLHTAAAAAQVIIATDDNSSTLVYLSAERIVLQQSLPEHHIGFSLLDGVPAVRPGLKAMLNLSQGPSAPGVDITIAQPVLEQARAMLAEDPSPKKIAACAVSFTQTGLPPESAAAFALALARPVSTGYITIVRRDASKMERQAGFTWLAGTSGVWIAGLPHAVFPTSLTWHPASSHVVELAVDNLFSYLPKSQANL